MPTDQEHLIRLLHDAHASALLRYVLRLTNDSALEEDVVQESLFRAWQRPEVLARPEPAVRAWLFTVARHLVVDDWRSARKRHEVGTAEPSSVNAAGDTDSTDRILQRWLVSDALASLSAEHREVLLRGYYRSESTREIARQLQIPEGTVKSRMHYALRALRLALQEKGVTE
ncbi:sigma-70 family RNA polymerase sigma factor [Paenarthrobacter sp. Z7-10]|uniref:sigma-70 family RNA polymerase sigma factor n=1 Tax=Paenarthrobacter sp. Z7-10 TaxID=2787635 RepID=UPI0022A9B594|nr:sigma-70 family RNA polymerase sigma factor [Paenarthrobacter sp. Z7-10]MCZ2404832.1 sigma-70 family RNA polymerase sigma factor [Paenarthrobacter sp. Z7-10]